MSHVYIAGFIIVSAGRKGESYFKVIFYFLLELLFFYLLIIEEYLNKM